MANQPESELATTMNDIQNFNRTVVQLVSAKEAMADTAIGSNDPRLIKEALTALLEGNKILIAALDIAYRRLNEARAAHQTLR